MGSRMRCMSSLFYVCHICAESRGKMRVKDLDLEIWAGDKNL